MATIASIDGENRLIYLHADTVNESIHPLEIYKEVREFRRNDEELRKYTNFMKGDGNIPKGGGKFTERYFTLIEGTRIVPYNVTHVLSITGTLLTDDGKEGVFAFNRTPLSTGVAVDIQYIPAQVEVITIQAGSGLDDTQNTLLEEIHSGIDKVISIDSTNIVSGNGSPSNPFNSFALAMGYSSVSGIKKFKVYSSCVLDVDVEGIEVIGQNQVNIDLNGASVDGSSFADCQISGSSIGSGVYRECNILHGTSGLNGVYHECALSGDLAIELNAYVIFSSCFSGIAGAVRPSVDLISSTLAQVAFRSWSGGVSINNMIDGTALTVGITNGGCRFEANCTGGVANMAGTGNYENLGTSTIIDKAFINQGGLTTEQHDALMASATTVDTVVASQL